MIILLSALFADTRSLPTKPAFSRYLTACEVVTRTDVERAVARKVNNGVSEEEGPSSTCDYATSGGLVSITIQRLKAKPDLATEAAALRKNIAHGTARAAAGFDEGFYFDIPEAGTQLHLIDGGSTHVMVSILGMGEGTQVSGAAAQIARKAIAKLGRR